MSAPRIAPGTRRELGLPVWAATRLAGRRMGIEPPALFTVLGKHRRLLRGWLWFAGTLMPRGRLPRPETELVILRVAALRDCAYERGHHEVIARRAGLSREEIERVGAPDAPGPWTARQAVILRVTAALVVDDDVDDALWDALRAELSEVECLELCLLVGHYTMLATVIGTLRIPPDPPRSRR